MKRTDVTMKPIRSRARSRNFTMSPPHLSASRGRSFKRVALRLPSTSWMMTWRNLTSRIVSDTVLVLVTPLSSPGEKGTWCALGLPGRRCVDLDEPHPCQVVHLPGGEPAGCHASSIGSPIPSDRPCTIADESALPQPSGLVMLQCRPRVSCSIVVFEAKPLAACRVRRDDACGDACD